LRHLARGRLGMACAALSAEDAGHGQGDWRAGVHGASDRSASLRAEAAGLALSRKKGPRAISALRQWSFYFLLVEVCEEPTAGGRGTRKGAVKKHSQRQTKLMEQNCWTKRSRSSGEFLSQKMPGRTAANLLTRNVARGHCGVAKPPTIIADERRIAFHFVPQKTELVARATDEQAAPAEVIARRRLAHGKL
jgi:hypothetical protein